MGLPTVTESRAVGDTEMPSAGLLGDVGPSGELLLGVRKPGEEAR
jgi:hypothetical protein